MKLALISDPHFDHCQGRHTRGEFNRALRAAAVDLVVITGDIDEGGRASIRCRELGQYLDVPVVFVHGNHDFYGTSLTACRERSVSASWNGWLGMPLANPRDLGSGACLVGVDGWYDFRAGRAERTRIAMNDWYQIHDFMPLSAGGIVAASRLLAEQSAELATRKLQEAVQAGYTRIILATHVPPFVECATHEGQPSDADWAAIMVNVTLGDALFAFATEHPDVHLDVLCGHTHDRCDRMVAPNLRVRVGRAEYGRAFFEVVE